ncbi:MAG: hypothetical protein G01um101477_218 [Candidatus Doudnabacteria bacterium Gr01-1014_77]|uniref:Uncharacterized protein n=1 Tax=Candidatus Doudnabacteria bacterium Gr01-1014_77 TaxID=2017133 RepID=A0A554JCR7_9BACT|nr:MAG: hypothetical protein G01um101477_218 [Candidatus Doudnabacteria bacterium Gr01-1014_77]
MNLLQMGLILLAILVVGYVGFRAFTKSIEALVPKIETAILKRGEERLVILKNQGVSVRNSTGNIWEEVIELEPGCTLISLVEEVVRYYVAAGHLNNPPVHADWLWVEMVRSTDADCQCRRVLIARIAEFPGALSMRAHEALRDHGVRTFEAAPPPSSGNGDHDREPVLAGASADGKGDGNSIS